MNKIPLSVYDFFGYLSAGYLLLAVADLAFDGGWLLEKELTVPMAIFWLVAAYVLGHIVAHLSSVVLEHQFLRGVLKSPEEHLFGQSKSTRWARLFPGNFRPLPDATQERVLATAARFGVRAPGRAFFFHCHPLVKRDQATLERLNNFLNLYGFCRNFSMALLLTVPICLLGAFRDVHWNNWYPTGVHFPQLLWAVLAVAGAIGMFYRYLKFFRHYTVEVFTTYAELAEPDGQESK